VRDIIALGNTKEHLYHLDAWTYARKPESAVLVRQVTSNPTIRLLTRYEGQQTPNFRVRAAPRVLEAWGEDCSPCAGEDFVQAHGSLKHSGILAVVRGEL
jgi:hypothetical protein